MPHVKHIACAITSSIFGFLYLNVLFICALATNLFKTHHVKVDTLPKNEQKLVLDVGYYVRLQNMELESFEVKTLDGFVLLVDRIVVKNESNLRKRYPVLLVPGLMQSSAAYCTSGPRAIAFELVRMGFDVYLGNLRGGFSPKHVHLKPSSSKMWDWSIDTLGKFDLKAMVEFVKQKSQSPKIALAAHSQGTTLTFLGLSVQHHGGDSELGSSISSFSALAPAVYAGPLIDRWFLKLLRVNSRLFHLMFGYRAFVGLMGNMRNMLPLRFFSFTGYLVFKYMLGWDDLLWDIRYRNRDFISAPVFVSAKLMFWWLGKGGFADRKCLFTDLDTKWFDENFPPLEVYACGRDNLVLSDPLINRIHTYETCVMDKFRVNSLTAYSHLDVLWAMDAHDTVARPMGEFIWENVKDKERWRTPLFNEK